MREEEYPTPAFVFQPEYELSSNATIEEREKVQKMLNVVSAEDAVAIERIVSEKIATV